MISCAVQKLLSLIKSHSYIFAFVFYLDRFGLGQAGRIPGSVNAMRVLSTSTDLEAAVADALVRGPMCVESL